MAEGYPANWPEIAAAVKAEAGHCCEHCGHAHDPASGHMLGVHHLDLDKSNCRLSNLVALCQKCHLHWQHRWRPAQLVMSFARPAWMARRGHG